MKDLNQDRINACVAVASSGTQDFTRDGECTGCGECCSNMIPLTRADITRISRYVARNHIKPVDHGVKAPMAAIPGGPVIDLVCPFLDDSRPDGEKCLIYPVRPDMCRYYICSPEKQADMFRAIMKDHGLVRGLINAKYGRGYNMKALFFPDGKSNGK